MRRRAPLQNLRGSDPMLLEVQLEDLLIRPSSQLEPPNLCDLFALDECEEAPKIVRTRVRTFIDLARAEMAEIADGSEMKTFVEELTQVAPARIPTTLRTFLGELAERESRDGTLIVQLLEAIASTEPEPFTLGEPTIRVQRAEAVKPDSAKSRTSGDARKTASRSKAPKKAPKPKPVVDVERQKWIRDSIIEMLTGVSENGLNQPVVIAGIRHRARKPYPRLGPHEVVAVLNDLLKRGVLRRVATRWSRA